MRRLDPVWRLFMRLVWPATLSCNLTLHRRPDYRDTSRTGKYTKGMIRMTVCHSVILKLMSRILKKKILILILREYMVQVGLSSKCIHWILNWISKKTCKRKCKFLWVSINPNCCVTTRTNFMEIIISVFNIWTLLLSFSQFFYISAPQVFIHIRGIS